MEDILYNLIINWDQTGIHYVPVGLWTMEKEGSTRVEIVGVDDKHQIAADFAGSLTGDFLPTQLIYKEQPNDVFQQSNFHQTHSENHWLNESAMKEYIE